ncbi:hypothetical protein DBO95_18360 [Yersinia pestis]|nr:hypothetical protein DBO95_18360 [Yersinia pestis]
MAMAVSACAPTAKSEGTGGYLDDTVVTTKVKAALLGEKNLKSTEINVETFKGRVQLSGFVSSSQDANRAVQVTRSVPGVKSVSNQMLIKVKNRRRRITAPPYCPPN